MNELHLLDDIENASNEASVWAKLHQTATEDMEWLIAEVYTGYGHLTEDTPEEVRQRIEEIRRRHGIT